MSDQPTPDLPSPELAAAYGDAAFQARLGSPDQPVREKTQGELNGMWARAVPEPDGPSCTVCDDGAHVPDPGTDPSAIPPGPAFYSFPPDLPAEVEPGFRAAAAGMRLTIPEGAELASAFAEAEGVVASLATDDDDASLADFTTKRLGADGLAHARKGFAHLRRHAPALADRLEQSGSTNHPALAEQFARIGRRLP